MSIISFSIVLTVLRFVKYAERSYKPKVETQRLHLLENALLTIRPTSVQSERIFSNVGKVATKVRARLSDKSLNAIIALRAFYQSESKTNTQ